MFAARLGIARGNLCDIEKGRRKVSLDRAAAWAKLLGYADWQFVALALQDEVRTAGLKLKVSVRAAQGDYVAFRAHTALHGLDDGRGRGVPFGSRP